MISSLKDYVCDFEKDLNIPLMTKSNDAPLVDYIVDAWKSLEEVPQIKFIGYEYSEKESEIDLNRHIFKREKRKKKKDRHLNKYIDDDRVGKLTVNLEITMLEKDPTTGKTTYQKYPIKKSMLIPLQDENGLFYLKSKPYYMIYQMVEKSTYTSSSTVTTKSLMPVAVKRHIVKIDDWEGNTYTVPSYYVYVFKKEINIILFYLSKGLDTAMAMLDMTYVIDFIEELPENKEDNKIYFPISSKCYIVVDREFFLKYPYVQSIIGMISEVTNSRTSLAQLNSPAVLIKKISNPPNFEKGNNILKYFGRLEDVTTQKILKLPDYYKEDIYALLKWMMQHFNTLRLKDNCDLSQKRLRCNECIASLFTKELSKRLNRIISMGDKASVETMREIFKFPGDILIQKMNNSGLLRFDDSVNDMTFFSKFKYTTKGPHSLGNKNGNNISIKYRDLHPSMLGRLDILVCGNSDPGTSGNLSQFTKMEGLYFDPSDEPCDFYFNLMNELLKRAEANGDPFMRFRFDNPKDFYNALTGLDKFGKEHVEAYATSIEGAYDLVVNKMIDLDDESAPNIDKDAKKKNKKERAEAEARKKLELQQDDEE